MYAEEVVLESVDDSPENSLSETEIVSYLVAIGANACRRNYDVEAKNMYQEYLNLPLSVIVDSWDHLDSSVKLSIIDAKAEEFKSWVRGEANV